MGADVLQLSLRLPQIVRQDSRYLQLSELLLGVQVVQMQIILTARRQSVPEHLIGLLCDQHQHLGTTVDAGVQMKQCLIQPHVHLRVLLLDGL